MDCVDAGVERGTAAGAALRRTQASQGDVRLGLGPEVSSYLAFRSVII